MENLTFNCPISSRTGSRIICEKSCRFYCIGDDDGNIEHPCILIDSLLRIRKSLIGISNTLWDK